MEILNEFTKWITKNYSHTKGGYRHRGDFYRNDKPVNLEVLKDIFIKEKQSDGNVLSADVCDHDFYYSEIEGYEYCLKCGKPR